MRDIAKANGSSVATLYNHFASKDALMLGVAERFYTPFIQQLRAAATADEPGLTRMTNMVHVTFTVGGIYRDEFMALSQDRRHVAGTPELRPLAVARNACVELWRHALLDGIADGSVDSGIDPAAVIWIVFASLTGLVDNMGAVEYTGAVVDPAGSLCRLLTGGLSPFE